MIKALQIKDYCRVSESGKNVRFEGPDVAFELGLVNVIQGRSGVGKTRFIRDLLGFECVQNPHPVLKIDSERVSSSDLRKISAYSPQFPQVIPGTLLENITFSDVDLGSQLDLLTSILDQCGLSEFFAENCNSEVRQNISGGEKSKIGLARALYANRPIYFLDEPFASLDSRSEDKVCQTLGKICESAVVVMISHVIPEGLRDVCFHNLGEVDANKHVRR
ncbi:ATP-binding cassette domain-containing protein [Litorivicinus sp.]|nr:ATP-binding cassette domain-containing protein [Litorivicinus sp.]